MSCHLTSICQIEQEETKALRRHTKAVATEQKQSAIFAKIKAAFEAATAELTSATENLDNTRTHAKQQSEALKTKTLEVEQSTRQKGTDDVRALSVLTLQFKGIDYSHLPVLFSANARSGSRN